jgi:hypothetical protein
VFTNKWPKESIEATSGIKSVVTDDTRAGYVRVSTYRRRK